MIKPFLAFILLISITSHVLPSESKGIKYISSQSQAAKCTQAIDYFFKNSDFLTLDLKKALSAYPEIIHKFSMALVATIYYASQRPQELISLKAETRLLTGVATCQDFVVAYREILCYGEHSNQGISELEPTSKEEHWQDSIIPEPVFSPSLLDAYSIIEQVGKNLCWSDEKITLEKNLLKEQVNSLINRYLSFEYSKNLNEEVIMLKQENQNLQNKISNLLKDYNKTQNELIKSKEDIDKLCDGMLPRNKMLKEACIIGAIAFGCTLTILIGFIIGSAAH